MASMQASSLPMIFIVLWSSGYIGGAIGILYAEPFTMTFLRFALAGLIMLGFALATRTPMPSNLSQLGHMAVVGFFMQALQFGGLYAGMKAGVPAGQSALIVGLMPVVVGLLAGPLLGERVGWRQWIGLALGLLGVVFVLYEKVGVGMAALGGYAYTLAALFGITAGTLYQKKFCGGFDLRTTGFVQMTIGAVVMLGAAWFTESMVIDWTPTFIASVVWLAVMNSIGALMLLYLMIRCGEATKVASLFFLIPPVTQIMASAMLGEIPTPLAMVGFGLASLGVWLANRPMPKAAAPKVAMPTPEPDMTPAVAPRPVA
ncbi:DMT family transporter [Salinarimonas ramus]|nr:DMT family transporter [Salinarimonas ramus]